MKSESQCQNNQKYYPYHPKSKLSASNANVYDSKIKQRNNVNKNVYHKKFTKSSIPSSVSSQNSLLPPPKSVGNYYIKSPLSTNIDLEETNLNVRKQKSSRQSNTWIYTMEELQTMKRACKKYITFEEELIQRAKAIHFIKMVCFKLDLGHHVLSAASIILHRYYVRKPIQDSIYQDIASACIFLACKLFESKDMRRMSDIVNACAKVSMKKNDFEVSEVLYGTWKRNIVHNEMEILEVICYDLDIDLPSKYIKQYTEALNTSKKLKKYIYCVINDCLATSMCLRYKWNVIVAAALYVSSKMIGEKINCKNNWWLQFSINENEMKNIIREMLIIYQGEVDSLTDRRSPMTNTHINVMSPPLSNPHPSQVTSISTSQLKNELDKTMLYSKHEEGMIPNVGNNQIPPSPTLSETSETSINKKLSRKASLDNSYNERTTIKNKLSLQSYLNTRATTMKD